MALLAHSICMCPCTWTHYNSVMWVWVYMQVTLSMTIKSNSDENAGIKCISSNWLIQARKSGHGP